MLLKCVNVNYFDGKMEMWIGRWMIEKENIIVVVYFFLEIYLIVCQLKIFVKKFEKNYV